MKSKPSPNVPQSDRAMSVLVAILSVGCLVIPLYAAQTSTFGQFASVVGVALVVAGSALLLGSLLGFLFGIPRTLQQEGNSTLQQKSNAGNIPKSQQHEITYAVNTNLEQISDWLTKILVGVGLTQLSTFPLSLRKYADYIGPELGNFSNSKVFSIALLLFFLITGFLISYLWTRLHLAGALRQADASNRLAAVETKLDHIDIDARAWSFVQRLLNPAPEITPPMQEEINATIAPATSNMKAQIFWATQQVRRDNWRNLADKPKMERTIPIFRALIASDTEKVYHANHGQLGYALKDQRNPDWAEAQAELTEAIRLRGNWQTSGSLPYYEFVRAICRINLDEAFKTDKHSDEKTKQMILSDIDIASSHPKMKDLVQNEPDIKKWMDLNDLPTP
jgi:hypothetical protein